MLGRTRVFLPITIRPNAGPKTGPLTNPPARTGGDEGIMFTPIWCSCVTFQRLACVMPTEGLCCDWEVHGG